MNYALYPVASVAAGSQDASFGDYVLAALLLVVILVATVRGLLWAIGVRHGRTLAGYRRTWLISETTLPDEEPLPDEDPTSVDLQESLLESDAALLAVVTHIYR